MARYKHSLRTRVIVAFALTGALIGTLFAVAAYVVGTIIERHFMEDTVGEELGRYLDQIEAAPRAKPVPSQFRVYEIAPGDEARLPEYLAGLSPGVHERDSAGSEYHVAVRDQGGKRYYLVYDATRIEYWEALLEGMLPLSALSITCLSFCLGRWLSARILAPVTRLAKEVRLLYEDPGAGHRISTYGDDEIGELARAFDQLIQRLSACARREAEFTADVSHELRTPVTVVRATTELLLSQTHAQDEPRRRPLLRLDRAGRRMSDLIDVFLMLARESGPSPIETAQAWSLEPVIREILDARSEDLKHKGLTVELDARGHPAASAPRAVLTVVFGNLLGNAIAYSRNGRIRITLEDDGAAVEDTGPGIPLSDEPHVFQRAYRGRRCPDEGAGLGLAIVQRLCGRYGWRVGVGSPEGQGARVWLDFSASAKSKG